jgi:RNA-directed DNA polymerase
MTKTPVSLQDLRRRLYAKAKAETSWRFWGLYVHVCKIETLREAYRLAKNNDGAPGIDGVTFADIEAGGAERFIEQIRGELISETYLPMRGRRHEIPKDNGKTRVLTIPTIRDRVVQGALKLILEPIFEADFQPGSFGYRPKRTAHQALERVRRAIVLGKTLVVDVDLASYFDNVRHHLLLGKVAQRVNDPKVMRLLKLILSSTGKKGVPQGGVISPLLSNIYLNEVDKMLERAQEKTRSGDFICVQYARFADDLVILVDGRAHNAWLLGVVHRRLREEFGKLEVRVNEEKSRVVDLTEGGSFSFLGFDLRRTRSVQGKWRPLTTPRLKARVELVAKLKKEFRSHRGHSARQLVQSINPILRGWVQYFSVGNSGRCFTLIRDWVEKKLRRHLMRERRGRPRGFGWQRWSRQWLHEELGLFGDYHVRHLHPLPKAAPAR